VNTLDPKNARLDVTVLAGDGWSHVVKRGETLRIVDVEGNQAVDTLFYDADEPSDRYDAALTIRRGGNLYLTTGSVLFASSGAPLMTITGDTCAATTPSAEPARARATRCATRSTASGCTPAATPSCWSWRRTARASASATSRTT
jgi:uncharacterized protein YcgI (DUF1989 family)